MDCSTPGLPVHHQLLEFTQTHVHWVRDAIQPSHSLSSPSPLTFSLSQHQGFFKWVSFSHQKAKILEFQLQHQSFQCIQDWFPLGLTALISLSQRDSQESSPKPYFKSISSLVFSFLCNPILTSIHDYWKKTELWLDRPLSAKSVPQPSDYFQSICSSDCKVVVPIGSDFAPQRAIDNVWRHF